MGIFKKEQAALAREDRTPQALGDHLERTIRVAAQVYEETARRDGRNPEPFVWLGGPITEEGKKAWAEGRRR